MKYCLKNICTYRQNDTRAKFYFRKYYRGRCYRRLTTTSKFTNKYAFPFYRVNLLRKSRRKHKHRSTLYGEGMRSGSEERYDGGPTYVNKY